MTCKTRKQTKKKLLRHNRRQHQHARTHAETHEKSRDVKTEKKKESCRTRKKGFNSFFCLLCAFACVRLYGFPSLHNYMHSFFLVLPFAPAYCLKRKVNRVPRLLHVSLGIEDMNKKKGKQFTKKKMKRKARGRTCSHRHYSTRERERRGRDEKKRRKTHKDNRMPSTVVFLSYFSSSPFFLITP